MLYSGLLEEQIKDLHSWIQRLPGFWLAFSCLLIALFLGQKFRLLVELVTSKVLSGA